jgi:hypothetical protein
VVCGWSSDRCFGLLLQTSPDATISELAAAMTNMRPDLVRSRAGPRLGRGNPASFSCQQIRVVNSRLADMTTTQDQRQEVISEFEFDVKVIDEDVVSQLRVTDDAGEAPRMVVNAEGSRPPMRCCLRHARAGEQMALVSYAPLRRWAGATGADPGPYSEIGPVFIHPEPCGGPVGTSGYPEELIGATHVFRAYRANGSILGGRLATGDELADEEAAGRVLSGLFANPEVAVVHARQLGAVLVIAPECLVTGLAVLSPGICQARADCAGRRGAGPGHGSGS